MTNIEHTPGPWDYDMDYIVASDPNGRFPDIYIAEIAHSDDEGRIASPEQQDANRHLIAAAPTLLDALKYADSQLSEFKADALKKLGLDVALSEIQNAIALTALDGPPWKTDAPPTSSSSTPYSVLLLYPDYLDDYGTETYYAFVAASDPLDAVAIAQRQAAAAQAIDIDDPTDFHPLLVTEGHHASEPLFNK